MNLVTRKLACFSLTALLMSAPATLLAHDHQSMPKHQAKMAEKGDIMLHMPWSRALPPVATNGAAYLMVHNNGNTSDKIIAIKSPIAKTVMMHQSVSENGNVHMEHIKELSVKPRGMINFKPGGYHVMLMGLNKPLVAGESFPITVVMEKAGEITGLVKIKKKRTDKKQKHSHQH